LIDNREDDPKGQSTLLIEVVGELIERLPGRVHQLADVVEHFFFTYDIGSSVYAFEDAC
jgi:hypothetical protein